MFDGHAALCPSYVDYQGMRVAKDMGGQIVRYSYDGKSVLTQSDINGQTIAKYEYGPDQLLSMQHVAEGRQFYLFDALGSVSNLTNTSGTVQARYQYDAFGNLHAEAGSSFNRFTFTGHEKDTETGLYYFKARFYDPDTGRFLNQDSYLGEINTPPSLHRYLYAYANPVVYVDLYGYSSAIATKKEFDQLGEELYAEGNVAGAALVALGSAFYEVGTGFFTGGQFDDVNQAITDNDTLAGAAKQYGTGVVESAKQSAQDYVEEGALKATGKLALKVGCGRARTACDTVSNIVDKATGKGGDVKAIAEGPKLDVKMKEPGTPEVGFGAKSGGGAGKGVPKSEAKGLHEENSKFDKKSATSPANGPNSKQKNADTDSGQKRESVYVHKDEDGNVNYIGISEDTKRRAGEHRVDTEKTGVTMTPVTDALTHDQARTIEGMLLRQRLQEARLSGVIDGTEPIQEQLSKAGLLNKNRGRNDNRWLDIDPDDFLKDGGVEFDIRTPK